MCTHACTVYTGHRDVRNYADGSIRFNPAHPCPSRPLHSDAGEREQESESRRAVLLDSFTLRKEKKKKKGGSGARDSDWDVYSAEYTRGGARTQSRWFSEHAFRFRKGWA